jgi:hypothetical protein
MRELFVFPTETEHQSTCQLVKDSFPRAEFSEVELLEPDPDILIAMRIYEIPPAPFIRWAVETQQSGNRIIPYCYNLSLAITANPMPKWFVKEILADSYLLKVFQLR